MSNSGGSLVVILVSNSDSGGSLVMCILLVLVLVSNMMVKLDYHVFQMSHSKTCIGIVGRKGRGKDTVARYLDNTYGYFQLSFAGPLKRACKEMFGFDDSQLERTKDQVDPFWGIEPRQTFQFVGTEFIRDLMYKLIPGIEDNFWLHRLDKEIGLYIPGEQFVVSDVRFPNELNHLKAKGFTIIRINSNVYNGSGKFEDHSSEQQIDSLEVDYEITNNGTKEELYTKIDALINTIYG